VLLSTPMDSMSDVLVTFRVLFRRAQVRELGFSPIQFVLLFEAASADRARLDASEYLESLEGRFEVVDVRPLERSPALLPAMTADDLPFQG